MSTYGSTTSSLPNESELKSTPEVPKDAMKENETAPITESDLIKLKRSAKIHAESLALLGQ